MQSAFMIDIQQVSLAMRQATPRSIIAIDEFGKGTESTGKGNIKRKDNGYLNEEKKRAKEIII